MKRKITIAVMLLLYAAFAAFMIYAAIVAVEYAFELWTKPETAEVQTSANAKYIIIVIPQPPQKEAGK